MEGFAGLSHCYGLDGYSFDGNYHPRACYCPACKQAYWRDTGAALPTKIDLDDVPYRQYLVWRGEKLEQHYAQMQQRLKAINPNAVLMSWTVNAGRYGHLLHSPRAMPTRLNRLFDLPMQEWWLDETNFGGSVAPAFGAAYLRATTGDRPCASEAYMMSRGNPYGTHSFPRHERTARALLAMTNGCLPPESFGWPGHTQSTLAVFGEVRKRERWITRMQRMPWAAMLVSEQTRQFYAYKDIATRFLPHVYGAFRVAMEEHLAVNLINDWDVNAAELRKYRALLLPNTAALSTQQASAIREYVRAGGGLVATCDTSLCDELGRMREDFALADVFGVSYRGCAAIDDNFWKERPVVATLTWNDHEWLRDVRLNELVPTKSVIFRGPHATIGAPKDSEVGMRMTREGTTQPLPAAIVRTFGQGRVVYFAAGLDAAMWSYSFPYQRRLLTRALEFAAGEPFAIAVQAPMCVQATFFEQADTQGRRTIVHLYNGINSTANHGLPSVDVPLREEAVPIADIRVAFTDPSIKRVRLEPEGMNLPIRRVNRRLEVTVPKLELHSMVVAER